MEFLTVEEAARRLRLPERTILGLINDGKFTALRWPVRIPADEVDAVLERCRIRPGELGRSLNQYRPEVRVRYCLARRTALTACSKARARTLAVVCCDVTAG